MYRARGRDGVQSLGPDSWALVLGAGGGGGSTPRFGLDLDTSFALQALLQGAPTKIGPNHSISHDFALVRTTTKNVKIDGFRYFLTLRPDHAPPGPQSMTAHNRAKGTASLI